MTTSTQTNPTRVAQSESESCPWQDDATASLIDRLLRLQSQMQQFEARFADQVAELDPKRRPSARNLLHYVALRRHDVRPLQEELVWHGLSSLGRCESYVMANVHGVLDILTRLSGRQAAADRAAAPVDYQQGRQRIDQASQALFGPKPNDRPAHIMVTMPTAAATDYALVRQLLADGMSCMRINCAHDDATAWSAMIRNLRRAEQELHRTCRVMMDLGGPKIRTGSIEPGPRVLKWRPQRDQFGRVSTPAKIWLYPEASEAPLPPDADAHLLVQGDWLGRVNVGDHLRFRDARGRLRLVSIVDCQRDGVWAACRRTVYVTPETQLRVVRAGRRRDDPDSEVIGRIGTIAPLEQFLVLKPGERLLVTRDTVPGRTAQYDEWGQPIRPASIGCTLPTLFDDVRIGQRILFDDGRIGGMIEEVHADHLVVSVVRAAPGGARLRADKGVNLPDSDLKLAALTDKDLRDLPFVAQHADAVAFSFVRRPEDVCCLQSELARLGNCEIGIILKIENRQACQNLPDILLAVMRSKTAGVMIARGDLAVECGWERLAELQEEILWMCEAAHLPVIWATQVLEGLAKRGLPSRAEVTDAAMGVRAECVMLNKGPHIADAVRALSDILRRMQDHQVKKRPMLRKLGLAEGLEPVAGADAANHP